MRDFFDDILIGESYRLIPFFIRSGFRGAPCGYFIFKNVNKKLYDEIDEHVHGGITFNKVLEVSEQVVSRFNYYIAPGKYNIIGFDMAHCTDFVDGKCIRTVEDCRNELIRVLDIIFSPDPSFL